MARYLHGADRQFWWLHVGSPAALGSSRRQHWTISSVPLGTEIKRSIFVSSGWKATYAAGRQASFYAVFTE